MPIITEISDFDLEMINILIKKEREEQNNAFGRPFLQIPAPNPLNCPKLREITEEKQNNDEIIIIDI